MKNKRKLAEHLVDTKGKCYEGTCSDCYHYSERDDMCDMFKEDVAHAWAVGYMQLHPVVRRYKTLKELVAEFPDLQFDYIGNLCLDLSPKPPYMPAEALYLLGRPVPAKPFPAKWLPDSRLTIEEE
jgi:hypothetical protein